MSCNSAWSEGIFPYCYFWCLWLGKLSIILLVYCFRFNFLMIVYLYCEGLELYFLEADFFYCTLCIRVH
jgi:hypothetical protein